MEIARQLLEGIAYAHAKDVVHRHIKPANIMLGDAGQARLMDFGIARNLTAEDAADPAYQGTPLYMAPEYIHTLKADHLADIFSMGMVLYEMLTGRPAVDGGNPFAVMHRIANAEFSPPSEWNHDIDEALDAIVMKSLLKNGDDRYAQASDMKAALEQYARPKVRPIDGNSTIDRPGAAGTMEFLLRRMRHKSDFPALSQSISTLNKIVASDDESVFSLSNVILKDFSLTNKLLRVVNSSAYGQLRGSTSTVSRAVMLMGFDTVRSLAMSLMLFEHLHSKSQAARLNEEIFATLFNGLLSKRLAIKLGFRDAEEFFVCAMFRNLGRLLAIFYLHDEALEVEKLSRQDHIPEDDAARHVLGLSYEELGLVVAKEWNLPPNVQSAMKHGPPRPAKSPRDPGERAQQLAHLADVLREHAATTPPRERAAIIAKVTETHGAALGLDPDTILGAVADSVGEFFKEMSAFGVSGKNSAMMRSIETWSNRDAASLAAHDDAGRETMLAGGDTIDQVTGGDTATGIQDTVAVLTAGIQDVTNSLVDSYDLSALLRMILETMFRALRFTRALLCVRDPKTNSLRARYGFGAGVDELSRSFGVPLGSNADVFHVALNHNADIFIADIDADTIKARVPAWYRGAINAASFLLLPMLVDKRVVGLVYAD